MPQRAFDITSASTETSRINAGETARLQFTVTNTLGRPVRIVCTPQARGGAPAAWATVEAPDVRDLSADGTVQVVVLVSVPAGTPAGTHSFSLLVANDDKARRDEEFSEGPIARIEVAAVEKKPFPLWILGVVIGVLVLIGGGIGIYLGTRDPEPLTAGAACTASDQCAEGLTCPPESQKCQASEGMACGSDDACTTGLCKDQVCATKVATLDFGAACPPGAKCGDGLACARGTCLTSAGGPCSAGDSCASGRCAGDVCVPVAVSSPCNTDEDCGTFMKCLQREDTKRYCLYTPGAACTADTECTGGRCNDQTCNPDDGSCEEDGDCALPLKCNTQKQCKAMAGAECNGNALCDSGYCKDNRCMNVTLCTNVRCEKTEYCSVVDNAPKCVPRLKYQDVVRDYMPVNEALRNEAIRFTP